MRRASWVAVAATLAVVAGVAALASQAARRDRTALLAAFGEEHLSRLRVAIREIESELADVGKDLAFASRLVEAAESGADQRRELEALLAVVRAYRMVSVFDGAGARRPSTKLVLLGPHGHPAPLSDPSLATLATSGEPPGPLAAILESMRAGRSGRSLVPEPVAERLGLGEADAVAVFAPSQAGDAGHWASRWASSRSPSRP